MRYFFIKSAMNGKVLDIEGSRKQKGAKVIMWPQKDKRDADNQLWFEDRYGNIRSKLNDQLVLDGSGELAHCCSLLAVRVYVTVRCPSVCLSVPWIDSSGRRVCC